MAPRALKPKTDDGPSSSASTLTPEVLKPKTEKAKVDKVKSEAKPKAKAEKATKAEKIVKTKAEKVEKVEKKKGEKCENVGKAAEGKEKGDGKEKVKPVTGDEAARLIVEYLRVQNRPFSATEVSANLHGKVTKTVADKILKELGEKQELGMNSSNGDKKGSQFVFWTPQDPTLDSTPEELALMDSTITALKSTIASLRSTLKSLTIKQNTLKSMPTTAQLQDLVSSLQTSNAGKASKLSDLKNGNAKSYSKEEIKTVERHWKHWANARKARKVAYLALEDLVIPVLEERMGCSREEVREQLGIEIED